MKAKYVTYGELLTGPGYNNKKVELTIEINEFEKADEAFEKAKQWVQNKLGINPELPF